jgi:hypothetical protein
MYGRVDTSDRVDNFFELTSRACKYSIERLVARLRTLAHSRHISMVHQLSSCRACYGHKSVVPGPRAFAKRGRAYVGEGSLKEMVVTFAAGLPGRASTRTPKKVCQRRISTGIGFNFGVEDADMPGTATFHQKQLCHSLCTVVVNGRLHHGAASRSEGTRSEKQNRHCGYKFGDSLKVTCTPPV